MAQNLEILNLMGTPCPMNIVMIKTTLDRMPAGELLQVSLDQSPVGLDVAGSLRDNGYDVVSIEERPDRTVVLVRKRPYAGRMAGERRERRGGGCGSAARRRRR